MDLKQTLIEAEEALAEAQRNVIQYEQLVSVLRSIEGVSAEPSRAISGGGSSLRIFAKPKVAVAEVMKENIGVPLTPKGVYTLIETKGAANPGISPTAYTTALGRLAKDDAEPIRQLPDGRYVYVDQNSFTTSYEFASLFPQHVGEVSDEEAS